MVALHGRFEMISLQYDTQHCHPTNDIKLTPVDHALFSIDRAVAPFEQVGVGQAKPHVEAANYTLPLSYATVIKEWVGRAEVNCS